MLVTGKHVNGRLRIADLDGRNAHIYQRVRPDISNSSVTQCRAAVRLARGEELGHAFLTITTELIEQE